MHVMEKGHSESSAFAICRSSLGLMSDGAEDRKDLDLPDDEVYRRAVAQMNFPNPPVLIKNMRVAPIGKNFINGDQEFDLTKDDIHEMVKNYKTQKRQTPVLFMGDHAFTSERADRPADGWIEDLMESDEGLMARVKLHGSAALAVMSDQFRGASIGAFKGTDPHGKKIGWILDHLLITNDPFFKDINIAASRSTGDAKVVYVTARHMEATMAETKQDPEPTKAAKEKVSTGDDAQTLALKAKDDEIVALKAKCMGLEEVVETLKHQIANAPVDKDKEELALRVARLERKTNAQEIRELVTVGLTTGTLKPVWCSGYKGDAQKGSPDEETLLWFKASKFEGDLKLLKWAVFNNPPMYRVGATFASGAPVSDKPMSAEDKEQIEALGHKPELVLAAAKAKSLKEYQAFKGKE
jgi:hypothetical protein